MRGPSTRLACWVLAALGTSLLAPPAAAATTRDVGGTYRLRGRAQVDARPFPATDEEVRADAVLSPGAAAGEVRIRLAGQGITCDLTASLDQAGALSLAQGQRCTADLRSDETEGRVEARLVSGSGSLRDEVLELVLDFALSGSVRARPGGSLETLGRALSLPGAGGDPVPVRGRAHGRAEGRRDQSRTAQ